MKLGPKAFFVLVCFATGATASTQPVPSIKVQRFADPVLCYLDAASTDSDAILVRAELQRREVACTAELKVEGLQAVEQLLLRRRLQAMTVSHQRAGRASARATQCQFQPYPAPAVACNPAERYR
ncbi:MAG: hypothetical protein ABI790_02690 [Betaproteobacteria bacterium]